MGIRQTAWKQTYTYAHAHPNCYCHALANAYTDRNGDTHEYGDSDGNSYTHSYFNGDIYAHADSYTYAHIHGYVYNYPYADTNKYGHTYAHSNSHARSHRGNGNSGIAYADSYRRGGYGSATDGYTCVCRDACAAFCTRWWMRVHG